MKGTLALSWGAYGGFYVHRHRLCLGWVALTYVPGVEVEEMMRAYLDCDEIIEALRASRYGVEGGFENIEAGITDLIDTKLANCVRYVVEQRDAEAEATEAMARAIRDAASLDELRSHPDVRDELSAGEGEQA